ncbi:MAG TPA: methyltransferase domain-containing protein [Spirochaetia bacterium]|nr:methyltransferase domain-containing protein [Spirochaetia bacterium]
MRKRVLLVPETRPGHGSGHLKRCIRLAKELSADAEVRILAGEKSWNAKLIPVNLQKHDPASRSAGWDLVVVDKRETSLFEVDRFRAEAPVVGIDAAGSGRMYMSYLIDPLPRAGKAGPTSANERGPEFLSLPRVSAQTERPGDETRQAIRKVLVTFGGEDAARLTEKTLSAVTKMTVPTELTLEVVKGPLFDSSRLAPESVPKGVHLIEVEDELAAALPNYGLIITSFGLTAFEARAAGVPVVVINPTRYHTRLARQAGFFCCGTRSPRAAKLEAFLRSWSSGRLPEEPQARDTAFSSQRVREAAHRETSLMAERLLALDSSGKDGCPVCGKRTNRSVARLRDRSFFRCSACGVLYLENYSTAEISYTRNYFFSDYEKQYGKTYIEDFPNIRRMARPRLRRITQLAGRGGSAESRVRLLDVGCAFGPFLAEAQACGYAPYGVDIAEEATAYVRDTLALPAATASIREFDPPQAFDVDNFDVVTMWYVIEHFTDVGEILKRVNRFLRIGGVFAFSTPSGSGVSARLRPDDFFFRSPEDHFTVWEPAKTKAILRRFGFALRSIRITGHHPERFLASSPNPLQSAAERTENREVNRLFLRSAEVLSHLLRLGDTFEAYAVKVREPD